MDILIEIDDVETGMTLSRPVKKDGQFLLPSGRRLKARDIINLKEWNVQSIYITSPESKKIA